MLRLLTALVFVTAATTAATAHADRAGTPGTVTAYWLDGRTVIDVKTCFRTTRYGGYDYVRCGDRLRDWLKIEVCRSKGAGQHHYFYQIGDGRLSRQTLYCRH